MSLKTAIQFRFLAAQLTKEEFHRFIDSNTNIIITTLFNQILNTSTNQQSDADNINNTISNIILSRKKKPKPIPTKNIKLDQLPKRLIGEICSFLDQYDNINFSKTNRFIFLSCNSPNLLKKLDLRKIENYSAINLSLYPSVKDLSLNLNIFDEQMKCLFDSIFSYKESDRLPSFPFRMNELEAIEVDGSHRHSDIDIDKVLAFIERINIDNVKKLRCSYFGLRFNNSFTAVKFRMLLEKFPNIQYLDLYAVCVTTHINANTIKDLYPNLKGLRLTVIDEDVQRSLINTFGNNLDFLSFNEYNNNFDFNLENTNFGKLQELKLIKPTIKSMNDILLTAKNLKKISIFSTDCLQTFMTPKETKRIMTKLITTCKSLQYIEFFTKCAGGSELLEPVLDGIENGLFETTKWKRKQMKVQVIVKCNDHMHDKCNDDHDMHDKCNNHMHDAFNPNDFVSNIGKIIHWLDYSEINDFMFIFTLIKRSNVYVTKMKHDKNIILLIKELKSKYLSTKITLLKHRFVSKILVTNINCKINGHLESWKM